MTMFDPTAGFPRDQLEDHLDNIGAVLATSGPLLDGYLSARKWRSGRRFTRWNGPAETRTFRGPFYQQREIDGRRERAGR